jgi:hypothetical protein
MRERVRLVVVLLGVLVGGVSLATQSTKLEFLTRDGCVNTDRMRANLDAALRSLERPIDYVVTDADMLDPSDVKRGYGTPTVLVNGRDLFGMPTPERQDHTPT